MYQPPSSILGWREERSKYRQNAVALAQTAGVVVAQIT